MACVFSSVSNSYAQEKTISGQITTLKNIAVVNAEVIILSSKATVLTDSAGMFKVNCLSKDKLKINAKGFKQEKVKINENTKEVVVDLIFNPTEKNIDQAIGYGYIKEEDRTAAISSAKNFNNEFLKYTNVIDAIINSDPSVNFDGTGFVIRGAGSLLGSSYAMIIIEGRQANLSQVTMLSPMDVDSIDILKGSASAIYGSRGANGVIIINVKTAASVK